MSKGNDTKRSLYSPRDAAHVERTISLFTPNTGLDGHNVTPKNEGPAIAPTTAEPKLDEATNTQYGTAPPPVKVTLAALQAVVEAEPDDGRAVETVANALMSNPLELMFEIMDAEAADDEEDPPPSPYRPELAHLTKEAEATAEEICEHWHGKRTIKLGIMTRSRKSPPADVTWDRREKNMFWKVFDAKTARAAAVEWTVDALLKGRTVFRGWGGYDLWHCVRPDDPPPPRPCGASAKPRPSSPSDASAEKPPLAA